MSANPQRERYEFLRQIPIFAELGEPDLKKLCTLVVEQRLAAGEELFRQGGPGDLAYVIREGEIQISRFADGREVPLAVRRAGEVIGEMALLEEAPRMATARARTDSLLLAIGREQLERLLTSSPTAARSMLGTVMGRLRETEAALRQSEKMAQLGTLAAGLAHELNNPAAAAMRGAENLREALDGLLDGPTRIAGLGLSAEQLLELARRMGPAGDGAAGDGAAGSPGPAGEGRAVEQTAASSAPAGEGRARELSPLERGDLEEGIEDWLESRGVEGTERFTGDLVEMGYGTEELERLAVSYSAEQLAAVIPIICFSHRARGLLGEIAQGSREIASIVKAMKSYVYLDQGPLQEVDLHEGLENTLIILRHKLKKGITVRRDFQPGLPRVPARGGELNQVWTNLIDNAADALGGRGQVSLRTRREGDSVVVEVEDDGPGIPPEIQPKVFTLFFTTKPIGQGSGQGLSTAYNIVRRHGGTLDFRSRPGRTVFTVRLPLKGV
jgi:signal transduction histidine kinase